MLKSRVINIIFFSGLFILILIDVFNNVSLWIFAGILFIYICLQVYGSINLKAQFFLPVKFKGPDSAKAVAITFDDGPIAGKTERILDLLRLRKVPAAFFCIGYRVEAEPKIIQRIYDEGHLVGNHSYWHGKTFDLQSAGKIADELKETNLAISRHINVVPRFFRPPYGVTNPMVASAVKNGDYVTIGWSIRSYDTVVKDSSRLLDRITSALKSGDIILFHDYSDSMLQILPDLLDHISGLGLKIVRIDELLNEKAYV